MRLAVVCGGRAARRALGLPALVHSLQHRGQAFTGVLVVDRCFRRTGRRAPSAQRGAPLVAERRPPRRPGRDRGTRQHRRLYRPARACGGARRCPSRRGNGGRRPRRDPARARSGRGGGVLRHARRGRDRRRRERDAPSAPDRARARPLGGPLSDHDGRPARAATPAALDARGRPRRERHPRAGRPLRAGPPARRRRRPDRVHLRVHRPPERRGRQSRQPLGPDPGRGLLPRLDGDRPTREPPALQFRVRRGATLVRSGCRGGPRRRAVAAPPADDRNDPHGGRHGTRGRATVVDQAVARACVRRGPAPPAAD